MDIIFCGNPGVGKSTLLSSISNLPFESGFSWGEGLTYGATFKSHPNLPDVRFADTPGLADITKADGAATAITKALSDGVRNKKRCMIFFVVTLEAGRVRPDDLFTIKQVMESISLRCNDGKPSMNSYGVIFNKCTFLHDQSFVDGGKNKLEKVFGLPSKSVPITTTYLYFLPNVPQLVDQSNCTHLFHGLVQWVFAFPGIEIGRADKIDVSDIESKLKEMKEVYGREAHDLELKLKRKLETEVMEMRRCMDESRRDMEERIRRAEEERRKDKSFWEQLETLVTVVVNTVAIPALLRR